MSKPPKPVVPPPCHWPNRSVVAAAGSTVGQAKAVRLVTPHPARPGRIQVCGAQPRADAVQPMTTFAARRVGKSERASAGDELVRSQGDDFLLNSAERSVRTRPNGTYNFVRIQGDTRNDQRTFVSARSGHAGLAAGRPVLYAGTIRFDGGKLDWWSNYSGTYQPMAAFRQQAQLPDDRFVPWQQLQMGGVGLQRGMFQDRRDSTAPQKPNKAERPAAASAAAVGTPAPAFSPTGSAAPTAPSERGAAVVPPRPVAPTVGGAASTGRPAVSGPASTPASPPLGSVARSGASTVTPPAPTMAPARVAAKAP